MTRTGTRLSASLSPSQPIQLISHENHHPSSCRHRHSRCWPVRAFVPRKSRPKSPVLKKPRPISSSPTITRTPPPSPPCSPRRARSPTSRRRTSPPAARRSRRITRKCSPERKCRRRDRRGFRPSGRARIWRSRMARCTSPSRARTSPPVPPTYTAVLQKNDGGVWQIASTRHSAGRHRGRRASRRARQPVKGDWTCQKDDTRFDIAFGWDDSGQYITGELLVTKADPKPLSSNLRFGWDAAHKTISCWTFDDAGGFAKADWTPVGDIWQVRTEGTTAEGEAMSANQTLTFEGKDTFVWSGKDRLIDGEDQPEAKLRFVRQSPRTRSGDTLGMIQPLNSSYHETDSSHCCQSCWEFPCSHPLLTPGAMPAAVAAVEAGGGPAKPRLPAAVRPPARKSSARLPRPARPGPPPRWLPDRQPARKTPGRPGPRQCLPIVLRRPAARPEGRPAGRPEGKPAARPEGPACAIARTGRIRPVQPAQSPDSTDHPARNQSPGYHDPTGFQTGVRISTGREPAHFLTEIPEANPAARSPTVPEINRPSTCPAWSPIPAVPAKTGRTSVEETGLTAGSAGIGGGNDRNRVNIGSGGNHNNLHIDKVNVGRRNVGLNRPDNFPPAAATGMPTDGAATPASGETR